MTSSAMPLSATMLPFLSFFPLFERRAINCSNSSEFAGPGGCFNISSILVNSFLSKRAASDPASDRLLTRVDNSLIFSRNPSMPVIHSWMSFAWRLNCVDNSSAVCRSSDIRSIMAFIRAARTGNRLQNSLNFKLCSCFFLFDVPAQVAMYAATSPIVNWPRSSNWRKAANNSWALTSSEASSSKLSKACRRARPSMTSSAKHSMKRDSEIEVSPSAASQ
mmetsp:Transcript_11011/g.31357  ORF Transcript_11011/g.31357 Transcript_11011/m.31357 type:complete len:220 (-) Transcript_11011:463-1122(-)